MLTILKPNSIGSGDHEVTSGIGRSSPNWLLALLPMPSTLPPLAELEATSEWLLEAAMAATAAPANVASIRGGASTPFASSLDPPPAPGSEPQTITPATTTGAGACCAAAPRSPVEPMVESTRDSSCDIRAASETGETGERGEKHGSLKARSKPEFALIIRFFVSPALSFFVFVVVVV